MRTVFVDDDAARTRQIFTPENLERLLDAGLHHLEAV